MFLQDIGVGVHVVCWCTGTVREHHWHLRRNDTKQERVFAGQFELMTAHVMVDGINLGLEPQGKRLQAKGYTKLDRVEALETVFSKSGMQFTTEAPAGASEDQWIRFDDFNGHVAVDRLMFRQATLDREFENLGLLYEVVAIP